MEIGFFRMAWSSKQEKDLQKRMKRSKERKMETRACSDE